MHIPRPRSRYWSLVKKKNGSETGKELCLIKNLPGFEWWLLILATPHSHEACRGLRVSGFRAVLRLNHPAVVSWCNTFRGGDCCAYGTWLGCSVFTKLAPAAQVVPKSWLEMGAEAPGPGRCFLVIASRGPCPQRKAHPFGNISPFQYLLNMFSVSLQLLREKNPEDSSVG